VIAAYLVLHEHAMEMADEATVSIRVLVVNVDV
jgi:hypothetical protein